MASQMHQIKQIKEALKREDIPTLRTIAKETGFINNRLRKQAWSLILGVNKYTKSSILRQLSRLKSKNRLLSNQLQHKQIEKDIGRSSMQYYQSAKQYKVSQHSLGKILHEIFDDNHSMHYIQGINDVASVIYAVCNDEELTKMSLYKIITHTHLREFIMTNVNNFDSLLEINKIIQFYEDDCLLNDILNKTDLKSIACGWILTNFAHQIRDLSVISRLYDYILYSDKDIILYLSAAVFMYLKKEIVQTAEMELPIVLFFNQLKWDNIDWNAILKLSEKLFAKVSPKRLNMMNAPRNCVQNGNERNHFADSPDSTDSIQSWDQIDLSFLKLKTKTKGKFRLFGRYVI